MSQGSADDDNFSSSANTRKRFEQGRRRPQYRADQDLSTEQRKTSVQKNKTSEQNERNALERRREAKGKRPDDKGLDTKEEKLPEEIFLDRSIPGTRTNQNKRVGNHRNACNHPCVSVRNHKESIHRFANTKSKTKVI